MFSWQLWTHQQTSLALSKVTGEQFVPGVDDRVGACPRKTSLVWLPLDWWNLWSYFLHWFFSPLPFTSLDVFCNNWCILSVSAAPAGRWHCHMVSSSLCEPRCFFGAALDRSCCRVPALGPMPGWSWTELLLSLPILWCHIEVSAAPWEQPQTLWFVSDAHPQSHSSLWLC